MKRFLVRNADRLLALPIFILALYERLSCLFSSPERLWPHSLLYEGDAPLWADFATALNRHQTFELGLPIRTPGVAYLIHWLQPLGPPFDFLSLKILWCVASAAACALAFLAILSVFGRRVALVAGVMCAFSFGLDVTATSLNNETPYLLALAGITLLTLRFDASPTIFAAVGLGVLHGVATLVRAEHTLLLMLLLIASARKTRRMGLAGLTLATSILVCLPWSIHGHLGTVRFNESADALPDYDGAFPPWTTDARAYLDSLPAFTRLESFRYFTHVCLLAGDAQVTADRVRNLYLETFGSIPEPLDTWCLASSQGALSFALANHPQSDGGFSKAGLDSRWDPDPGFQPALPSHLALYNHGYRIGLDRILADPGGWLRLVRSKLGIFFEGVTLGFTAENLPYGPGGIRRPVDLVTPLPESAIGWRILVLVALAVGAGLALRRRKGGVFALIVGYKLLVTIAFYGYARQAVAVLPAFVVFEALAVDAVAKFLPWRAQAFAGLVLVLLCVVRDAEHFAARESQRIQVKGVIRPAPRWGPGAFESFHRLELIPVAPSGAGP